MNKLHGLSFFTLLNFTTYGTSIDVSSLVTYGGEVKFLMINVCGNELSRIIYPSWIVHHLAARL